MLPFFVKEVQIFWRDSKAVMPRIANPVSPVRLRVAPPVSGCFLWDCKKLQGAIKNPKIALYNLRLVSQR